VAADSSNWRYDLDLVHELCVAVGFTSRIVEQRVEVDLGEGAVLCFQNRDRDEDCAVGFPDTPWHFHGDLMFSAGDRFIEVNYLDLISGLRKGTVLVCERWKNGAVVDRWLEHSIHNDFGEDFKYMEDGERLVVRRV
jgi:hypothetical protein